MRLFLVISFLFVGCAKQQLFMEIDPPLMRTSCSIALADIWMPEYLRIGEIAFKEGKRVVYKRVLADNFASDLEQKLLFSLHARPYPWEDGEIVIKPKIEQLFFNGKEYVLRGKVNEAFVLKAKSLEKLFEKFFIKIFKVADRSCQEVRDTPSLRHYQE